MSNKLPFAIAVYVVLAVLAWFTLDASIPVRGHEVPLRAVTLAIIALFGVRTLLHWQRQRMAAAREHGDRADG